MAENEIVEKTDDADFDSGYSEDIAPTSEPSHEKELTEIAVETVVDEPPKLAQITEAQYQDLLSRATAIDEIKASQKRLETSAFGEIGGLKQNIQQLRQAQASGVEFTDQDFEGLDFPEVARELSGVIAKKLKVAPSQIDPAQIEALTRNVVQGERVNMHLEILDGMHPGWKDLTGMNIPKEEWANNDYRKWMEKQPQDYRERLLNSNNAFEISTSIKAFQDNKTAEDAKAKAKAEKEKAIAARSKRVSSAITPRGTGGIAEGKSDLDDFEAGYSG